VYLISHRGNLNGPNRDTENTIPAVKAALDAGYDCEVDVWFVDGRWYIGHDSPWQVVTQEFLQHGGLWCHAKNLAALMRLRDMGVEVFWHEHDERTLTSFGHIWTYPDKELCEDSICVHKGPPSTLSNVGEISACIGICSDYIQQYVGMFDEA
jgi:glycerophosphoryl diester phosphodiesterase